MPRGTDNTRPRPQSEAMRCAQPVQCAHYTTTIVFRRSGTRLHPNVWMEERCLDCDVEIDRKRVSRGYDVYSKRAD